MDIGRPERIIIADPLEEEVVEPEVIPEREPDKEPVPA
jgi:hypothetical protein